MSKNTLHLTWKQTDKRSSETNMLNVSNSKCINHGPWWEIFFKTFQGYWKQIRASKNCYTKNSFRNFKQPVKELFPCSPILSWFFKHNHIFPIKSQRKKIYFEFFWNFYGPTDAPVNDVFGLTWLRKPSHCTTCHPNMFWKASIRKKLYASFT